LRLGDAPPCSSDFSTVAFVIVLPLPVPCDDAPPPCELARAVAFVIVLPGCRSQGP